jgi:hypothetical protein
MLEDVSFDQSGWQGVRADIQNQIGGIAGLFIEHLVYLLGERGLTNLVRSGGSSSGDCSACECGETVEYNFILSSEPLGSDMSVLFSPSYGRYDAGQGWAAPYFTGYDQLDGEYQFEFNTSYNVASLKFTVKSECTTLSNFVIGGIGSAPIANGTYEYVMGRDGSALTGLRISIGNDTHGSGGGALGMWLEKVVLVLV